jgi:hypothetical protein
METLGKHFRDLTRAAFTLHGFGQADVLLQWPEIVGESLAQVCRPQRIKWPRAAAAGKNSGGTLHVTAMAGRGLDVQQAVPLIIERVNRFLGYGAIMAVKIEQSHDVPSLPTHPAVPAPVPQQPEGISEPGLAEALQRLGGGVAASRARPGRRSPQAS